jgi:hypothetical protein
MMHPKHNLKLLVALITTFSALVTVPQALAMSDKSLKQNIEDKANDTFRLRETKVEVAVEDGYVVLHGTVDLYIKKMLYEQIAWKTKGVVEVDNEIRVVPKLPQADADIKRNIMEVVPFHRRLQGVNLEIAVKGGAVGIQATFKHPSDVLFFKHRVAEIEGVIAINIIAKFLA